MSEVEGALIINSVLIVCATACAYISVPISPFFALTVLMMIDFATGLGKSYTLQIPITSYKLKHGAIAKAGALLIIISFGIAFSSLTSFVDKEFYISWVLYVFIMSELYSIVSNVYTIKTQKYLPEFEVISLIGRRIGKLMSKFYSQEASNNDIIKMDKK